MGKKTYAHLLLDLATVQSVPDFVLANLDFGFIGDFSGSMARPSARNPNKTRLQEVAEDCFAVASEAGKYDSDGLTFISFSDDAQIQDGVTANRVDSVFSERSPRGGTYLAKALALAIDKVRSTNKNTVFFVYHDGAPDDEAEVVQLLTKAGRELNRPRIGFVFIQVGNEPDAPDFLARINDDLPVDVVAVVLAEQSSKLSVPQLVWLAQNK